MLCCLFWRKLKALHIYKWYDAVLGLNRLTYTALCSHRLSPLDPVQTPAHILKSFKERVHVYHAGPLDLEKVMEHGGMCVSVDDAAFTTVPVTGLNALSSNMS